MKVLMRSPGHGEASLVRYGGRGYFRRPAFLGWLSTSAQSRRSAKASACARGWQAE